MLIALLAGEAAAAAEEADPAEQVGSVLRVLRSIFEPKGVRVPAPCEAICTRWGSDPMAYGSYSVRPPPHVALLLRFSFT